MNQLGKKFDLDVSIPNDYKKLISKSDSLIPQNGALSKKWNYAFHGLECGFHNRVTQQHVEVVLENEPHFGRLESWFLLSFMKSTEPYKKVAEGLNWQDLDQKIEELYDKNEIDKI